MAQAITAPGDVVLVPESELSDPRLRLPDGGRRDPLGAVGADAGILPRRSSARSCIRSRSRSRWWSAIRPIRPPMSPTSISTRTSSPSRRSTASSCCPISPMRKSISTTNPPPSVLQVPGAMDVAVEFTSMSKTFSMPGWRMGFAVGNERIIAALARVKSYLDYGAFTPVQVAATAALNGPDDCIREMRATYKRRRDVLVEVFGRAGWQVPPPRASMFAWAPLPEPFRDARQRRILQAAGREGRGRGLARHRLRRARRGLCAHRAGRERAAHPPGRPQHPPLS